VADSAQGIDVSHYQNALTVEQLKPYTFAFAKATEGPSGADNQNDPKFAGNWATMKSAGVHRGAYHELWSASTSVESQADNFLSVVKGEGLEPGDMLAVAVSDYSTTDAEVKAWCDQVRAAAPTSPVLVYSQGSDVSTYTSCTGYDLWVAAWSDTPPASVAPWTTWRLWQWSQTPLDQDAYNGTAAEMSSWIASIANPADWTYGAPQSLTATGGHTSVRLTWTEPAAAPTPPARYNVFIYNGTTTEESTIVKSYPRSVTTTEFEGGSLTEGDTYTAHVVAEGPDGTRIGKDTYASVTFATGA
jgi:hypothetical protein